MGFFKKFIANQMALSLICLFMLCLFFLPNQLKAAEYLDWSGVAKRQDCPDEPSYLWIKNSQGVDCIRYFSGGNLQHAPVVIVMFSGDRDSLLKRAPEDIQSNTRQLRESIATRLTKILQVPVVLMARPGTYGSSGDHRKRRQPREFLALNAALSALKERYNIKKFVLLGHSGGSTAAAAILTMGRTDIKCAVLASGAFDLLERSRRLAIAAGREPSPLLDATGLPSPYDPLYHIDGIVPDSHRKIYILGNPKDKVTPFDLQVKFFNAVNTAGHKIELREVETKPPKFHNLSDSSRLKIARTCAKGD